MTQSGIANDNRPEINPMGYIRAKKWVVSRFNEACVLHDRYAELHSRTGASGDLQMANHWADIMLAMGDRLDAMGGAL